MNCTEHSVAIGDIERRPIKRNDIVAGGFADQTRVVSELTGRAGDKYPHG